MIDEEMKKTILTFAECNMRVLNTAKKMYLHKNTVSYRLDTIYIKTGLNPRNFYDLIKLVDMVKEGDKIK